jgi:hypothetical protein
MRTLDEALAKREEYLAENPHLREYQSEINRILDNSGDTAARMEVLGMLMQGKLLELQSELQKLKEAISCQKEE